MLQAFRCTPKAPYEAPLDGGGRSARKGLLITHLLPIVRKGLAGVNDVRLFHAERADITDHGPDVLNVVRIFNNGDEVLAAVILDRIRALPFRSLCSHCLHRCSPRSLPNGNAFRCGAW